MITDFARYEFKSDRSYIRTMKHNPQFNKFKEKLMPNCGYGKEVLQTFEGYDYLEIRTYLSDLNILHSLYEGNKTEEYRDFFNKIDRYIPNLPEWF